MAYCQTARNGFRALPSLRSANRGFATEAATSYIHSIETSRAPMSNFEPNTSLPYEHLQRNLEIVRRRFNRALTLSEKILYSHLCEPETQTITPGNSFLKLQPDRVAIHDANATMALLQFMSAGIDKTALPTTIHTDHLTMAEGGARGAGDQGKQDLIAAKLKHKEVFEFLATASARYGLGFWKPGSGILHTILFENYCFPGGLMIGTDSHTPNAAGMAMLGIGVGGSDAVDAMAGLPWELPCPKVLGVRLTGNLNGWASSKDIICHLAGLVTVTGGKGKIVEFFGPGVANLGATAMATIGNMSAEIGATSCVFPYTEAMERYLQVTNRSAIAKAATQNMNYLTADEGGAEYYDDVVEINLDTLEPHINGPFTPDLSHPLSKLGQAVSENGWPKQLAASLVGSCTNSSYEDLMKVAGLLDQAKAAGLKMKTPFYVSTGSEQIRATAEDAGFLNSIREAGAVVLSSSCGPCVGQWNRTDVPKGEANSVISSFNRNFTGRHDGNPKTHSFVTSPELATAFAFSGSLDYNPATDFIPDGTGKPFRFEIPTGDQLPKIFNAGEFLYQEPLADEEALKVEVKIDPTSNHLQKLSPFAPWQKGNAENLPILIKVKGKCTTDHISPAGPWYDYRGHLDNISNNLLLGAENAFHPLPTHPRGITRNVLTDSISPTPVVARAYKESGTRFCIIGHDNYGEGSSREHAALEPRYLGASVIIAPSFARIHETNLKKQGVLPLTFSEPGAWERIREDDRVTVVGVEEMRPGRKLRMVVVGSSGDSWETWLDHSYHEGQIPWLMEGSALNHIRAQKSIVP